MTNKTIMQYFEWYLPENSLHWKRTIAQAAALRNPNQYRLAAPRLQGCGRRSERWIRCIRYV